MFLSLTHQTGLAQEAQSLCRQFTDYKEERFAAPALNHHRGPPDPENRGPLNRLTWASLNIRSIYGREKSLVELMRSNQISVLALQETFERSNDPPVAQGCFQQTFGQRQKGGHDDYQPCPAALSPVCFEAGGD